MLLPLWLPLGNAWSWIWVPLVGTTVSLPSLSIICPWHVYCLSSVPVCQVTSVVWFCCSTVALGFIFKRRNG